ncbi:hypothetical protein C4579_03760 [Candidatus Microgenomates bacterium]|nr:MAG: hypothetical protein C4579_03760 [Candidatus Microgenomates bacterium]
MHKQLLKDGLGWGFILWLIGYFLGIVLFLFVPPQLLGWVITPFGIAVTIWVLLTKIHVQQLNYYFKLGLVWAGMAIIFDYLFIVKLFKPEDGYYKVDVYLYYVLAFALPLLVGWYTLHKKPS